MDTIDQVLKEYPPCPYCHCPSAAYIDTTGHNFEGVYWTGPIEAPQHRRNRANYYCIAKLLLNV